jgi:hypothetical protein
MRRSSTQLGCNPALIAGGIAVFVVVVVVVPWLRLHQAGLGQAAREAVRVARLAGAALAVLAAYLVLVLTARAVSGTPVPAARRREEIDLAPEPEQPEETAPEPPHRDPDLAPAVYPGRRLPADAEPERVPETRQEVPK